MKKKRCLSVVIISLLLGISCFIMAGCANKDNEDKDDTKIEQNLDKKEDAEVKKEKKAKEESNEEKLQKQLAEKSDQLLRIAAEYDNFRKRSQREKDALYVDCKASVIKELLPVADNFDRIFANPDITFEDYKKGVEMTFKQFENVFKDLKVESFGEEGEEFDPNLEQALMTESNPDVGNDLVVDVLLKGYKLKHRVIRPASVKINKLD